MSFPLPLSINDADAAERSVSYFTERKIFSALSSAVNDELSERGRSGFCQLFEKHGLFTWRFDPSEWSDPLVGFRGVPASAPRAAGGSAFVGPSQEAAYSGPAP